MIYLILTTGIYNCINILALYEAHFEVPMVGAKLNTVNVRLNASIIASFISYSYDGGSWIFCLGRGGFEDLGREEQIYKPPLLHVIGDSYCNTLDHSR